MADIPSHHMVYGTILDYLTGSKIVDTDDERYRQNLAKLFVEQKGYLKSDLKSRVKIETLFNNNYVVSSIDLVVSLAQRQVLVVRYGPGSIVTRERPALAAARVIEKNYVVPYTIVTNGEDAELLETCSGKVLGVGMEAIPDKSLVFNNIRTKTISFEQLPVGQREKELRILNAYDQEVCCVGGPCVLPSAKEG